MVELLGVSCVYCGLVLGALALLFLVGPPARFVRTRKRAAALLLVAPVLLAAGFALPWQETRVERPRLLLDGFVPIYQFHEHHSVHVAAAPGEVFRALRAVTADEILFFRALTFLRRLGRPGPESILNAPERQPLLDVATRTSFLLLAEDSPREIVVGTLVIAPRGFRSTHEPTPEDFRTLSAPGFAKAAMSFWVEPEGEGSRLSTETRVFATDSGSAWRFARYWRAIYPGSALIRRMWLRAAKRRAEAGPTTP